MDSFTELFEKQRRFYLAGHSLNLNIRAAALRSFAESLRKNEKKIGEAVFEDIKKPFFETFSNEIASVLHEISWTLRNLKSWTRTRRIPTNLANFPGRSHLQIEPYGNALVIGTWNYPVLLNLKPAVSAIAAGNVLIIKPSEHSPHSSSIIASIVGESMDPCHCSVVEGGVPEVTTLLQLPFDKIFFTGSTTVGKIIMKAASEHLAHITLELGGKCPSIVLPDANLNIAAKRIVWGKFLNAGQSCIAPDYLLVHESIAGSLIENLVLQIRKMFGEDPEKSDSYGRIIDERHFVRLTSLIDPEKVVTGGKFEVKTRYISPTILYPVDFDRPVMNEEIFGPILPVLTFKNPQDVVNKLKSMPKPLALYVFTESRRTAREIMSQLPFGGGCINDTVMQIANPYLPFGGTGPSGTGRYHGRFGILEFSHQKPLMVKPTWFDPFFRYAPYNKLKESIIRKIL